MNRRDVLRALAAGGGVVAGELWIPGAKLISIPRPRPVPAIERLLMAWMDDRMPTLCEAEVERRCKIVGQALQEAQLFGQPMIRTTIQADGRLTDERAAPFWDPERDPLQDR